MRKYFLLGAVAMLATNTANATTDYAEVTAKATIEVAGILDCSSNVLECGTIVVKQYNKEIQVPCGYPSIYGDPFNMPLPEDVISHTGGNMVICPNANFGTEGTSIGTIELISGNNKIQFAVGGEITPEGETVMGRLTIPANVPAGPYTGSFTITSTY